MVREMRRLVILGLLAMLVLAASASGRGTGFITLKPGDELDVVGTKILCQVTSEGPGEMAIACFKVDSKGPIPGSYAVDITQKGGVSAWKIDAKRSPQPVYTRNLSSAQTRIKVRVRQKTRIQGTTLDCAIVLTGARNDQETIYCSRDDKVGPIVGSYAVLMSDSLVAVAKIKADRSSTVVWTRKH